MSVWLALVGALGVVAALGLLVSAVRRLRETLSFALSQRRGLDAVTEGAAWVEARVYGEGHVDDLDGRPALYTSTTVQLTTRRTSPGSVRIQTFSPGADAQPGARVVPLLLRDDAGRTLALSDVDRVEILDGALERLDVEVPVEEMPARFPDLPITIDAYTTHVGVSQRALREGTRVVVRGVARVGAPRNDEAPGYRQPASVMTLGAPDGEPLLVVGASRVGPLARAAAGLVLVSCATGGLLASSWLALQVAWQLSRLAP